MWKEIRDCHPSPFHILTLFTKILDIGKIPSRKNILSKATALYFICQAKLMFKFSFKVETIIARFIIHFFRTNARADLLEKNISIGFCLRWPIAGVLAIYNSPMAILCNINWQSKKFDE